MYSSVDHRIKKGTIQRLILASLENASDDFLNDQRFDGQIEMSPFTSDRSPHFWLSRHPLMSPKLKRKSAREASPHLLQPFNTMRWPPWSSNSERDTEEKRRPVSWTDNLNATDWSHYTDPRTIIPTLLLTTTILASVRLYRSYLRRIPEATHIRPGFFRKRSLFGTVTRVGDADNFHLFHTPGGRLAGWGWLPGRKIPQKKADLKGNTVESC